MKKKKSLRLNGKHFHVSRGLMHESGHEHYGLMKQNTASHLFTVSRQPWSSKEPLSYVLSGIRTQQVGLAAWFFIDPVANPKHFLLSSSEFHHAVHLGPPYWNSSQQYYQTHAWKKFFIRGVEILFRLGQLNPLARSPPVTGFFSWTGSSHLFLSCSCLCMYNTGSWWPVTRGQICTVI